jgi:hypothetical protein
MKISDIPGRVERTHEFPVSHETLRAELGSARIDVPNGQSRPAAMLLDTCADYGFGTTYETPEDLRAALLCCADAAHVGRVGYDDRGHNPHHTGAKQVSF